jgi:hypothetical protein
VLSVVFKERRVREFAVFACCTKFSELFGIYAGAHSHTITERARVSANRRALARVGLHVHPRGWGRRGDTDIWFKSTGFKFTGFEFTRFKLTEFKSKITGLKFTGFEFTEFKFTGFKSSRFEFTGFKLKGTCTDSSDTGTCAAIESASHIGQCEIH